MAIRIQQYNTGTRRIGVGGIDPGYQQPRIGNIAATAENQLAGTVLEAGKALTNVAIKEYVSTETTRVSQSLLAMQKELSAERDRYMAENQGQNAIEAGQHFEKFARETAQKYFQEGGFSGRFAEMFNKQAAGTALHFTEQGQAYGRQQKAAWEESVLTGEIEDFQNLAAQNYNNPELIEFNRSALRERIENMRPGMDNRALLSRIDEGAAESIISGYLAHDDIKGARGALNEYRGLLGDKVNAVELQIRNRADALEAKARAEAERAQNQAAAQLGISLFQQYGNNAESVQEQIGKIKDPVMQGKAIQSYLTQQGLHERLQQQAEVQQKAAAYNDGVSQTEAVLKDTNLTNDEKNTRLAEIQAGISDPKTRKSVADYQDFLINGVEAPVNDRIFADAQSYAAQPGVTPDMVTARFSGSLPPSALQKVRKNADDQQWKQEEQLLKDDLISTLKNRFNYRDADAQSVYRLILSQLNGTVGYEARRKKAQSLAVEITVDKGRWSWGKDIPAASLARYQEQGYQFSKVVEIPETVKPMIDEALSVQGKELTDENRKALYQKYLKQQGK
ncbi:hypothetical protein [Bilophila wadsworthia]|uniref:hypothetical protein n=1 Tax=Bilophila wadsworthia TaxID=35833 RepID=UPI003AB45594